MTGAAISLEGLGKSFGAKKALDGVDLEVPAGQVFGLLGPNGAGKTTTVRIISTLLRPDRGRALVAGEDVVREPDRVRRRIGLSGQYAAVDDKLTGYENLYLVAKLYGMRRRVAADTARDLLARFHLEDAADRAAGTYSGGMRRRLDLAGALVAAPPVVVLDEPTTGLDPQSRLDTWDVVGELVGQGTTVLLTTQYLEEADQLADRIAVIAKGKVIAEGTSDELKAATGGERLEVVTATPGELATAHRVLAAVGSGTPAVDRRARRIEVAVGAGAAGQRALAAAAHRLIVEGVRVLDMGMRRSTLDDVFLALTGEVMDSGDAEETAVLPEVLEWPRHHGHLNRGGVGA
ncbi:ABC-type multidrug transport system, ATPase component [Actinokineospora spheciospongiae]|uniref:ABC-type multidrug transport system, ATPase component n=1 Tax=Actinokineospora spheciospongiae TaxID=909613 RepID=W7INA0_9PSEU|nr:ATP-binding cassette domain-containing protein [Actinokineospora spheciospongiae]EWC58227.1 ABC-type multidrug transport system, ATPase component [Actinokineospora spheciospongiae]PWW67011.1 ABC-2 type transport system ATP-binding protein [Actinokineospora spheciospongiae]